ncbi:MAG: hypothetical protein ACRD4I_18215 [Candidatus Angelobacter sp.]|jgi:surface polysaccharide O-acyltransferase-like enzyme
MNLSDAEFTHRLTVWLAQFSQGERAAVPLFFRADGSLDREKTLALPCYAGFRLEQ